MERLKGLTVGLGVLCGVATGTVHDAYAGVIHFLHMAPSTLMVRESGAWDDCYAQDTAGGVSIKVNSLCVPLNTVKLLNFAVPWAYNPTGYATVDWYAKAPANTTFRARLLARHADQTLISASNWVSGGGYQGTNVPYSDGPVLLRVEMSSSSASAIPTLTFIDSTLYSE